MKVALHTHTNRYSLCSRVNPQALVSCLLAEEFEAAYITEHDTVWPQTEMDALREEFPEILLFGGTELTVEGCHLIVLGTHDPAFTEIGDAAEIIRRAREEGCATMLAHPLRWEGGADVLHCGEFPDALECGTPNHDIPLRQQALRLAEQLDMAAVYADDVHDGDMVGWHWIETETPLETDKDILKVLANRSYRNMTRIN